MEVINEFKYMRGGLIDAHAHLAKGDVALAALLGTMAALGIEQTVVVSGGTVSPYQLAQRISTGGEYDVAIDNETLLNQCRAANGKLVPFFFANPHRGAAEYCRVGKEFRGLKLAPAVHGVKLGDPRHDDFFAAAKAFGHATYLHCIERDGFRVNDLVTVAKAYPTQKFILGHAGIGILDLGAIELVEHVPNILFETSGGLTMVVKEAARRLGIERLLFGSEYPLQDPRVELEKARVVGFSPEAYARFTRLNALDLIREAGGHD